MITSFYVDARGAIVSLNKSKVELKAMLEAFVGKESDALLAALKKHAPKKTGIFAGGLRRYRRPAAFGGNVISIDIVAGGKHGYLAPFIMKGTRPHTITSTRPMPIKYGDQVVSFAYSVRHPGTKPSKFVEEALSETNRGIGTEAQGVVRMLSMMR